MKPTSEQRLLRDALKKHPFDTCRFIVIETCDYKIAHELEIFWIKEFNSWRGNNQFGLNLTTGGKGTANRLLTGNSLKRRIGSRSGEKNANFGKKFTDEHRLKLSLARKGKPSPNKGRVHTLQSRINMSKGLKGRVSPNKGKIMSLEQRQKLSESHSRAKLVLNFENGIYYNSVLTAAESIGINDSTLRYWLNGRYPNRSSLKYA